MDFTTGSRPASVAAADFNGDGELDLAVANYKSNNVSVLLNTPELIVPPGSAVGTIIESDSPPTVQFSTANETVDESTGTFSITVTLQGATDAVATIPFTISGGTAVDGIMSPLVIPAGQTSATITGHLIDDPGPSQTLTFTLETPTNRTLGATTTNTLTITGSLLNVVLSLNPSQVTSGVPIVSVGDSFDLGGSFIDLGAAALQAVIAWGRRRRH